MIYGITLYFLGLGKCYIICQESICHAILRYVCGKNVSWYYTDNNDNSNDDSYHDHPANNDVGDDSNDGDINDFDNDDEDKQ